MKSIQIILLFHCLFISQDIMAKNQELITLTKAYYSIKDALIADDGKAASLHAEQFLKSLDAVSNSKLTGSQQKFREEQKLKLQSAGQVIARAKDLAIQREYLNDLSTALFTLLKSLKANEAPVYYFYCPMKKSYWLSSEKEVKNPYYGKQMLSCGSLKETLN